MPARKCSLSEDATTPEDSWLTGLDDSNLRSGQLRPCRFDRKVSWSINTAALDSCTYNERLQQTDGGEVRWRADNYRVYVWVGHAFVQDSLRSFWLA